MSLNFLQICNLVLRRLNEVELDETTFSEARGIHALVKDAVRDAVAEISQAEYEWPFNAAEHSEVLTPGKNEYEWPQGFKTVDWNSFQIQKDETLDVGFRSLDRIERDEWYANYRDSDYDAGAVGISVPDKIFPSHGTGFGVTPSPDKAYEIRFRYYQNYVDLVLPSDETRIPASFGKVLVDGALFYLYMFKSNTDNAQLSEKKFLEGLKQLQSIYINNYDRVYDVRTSYGLGGRR